MADNNTPYLGKVKSGGTSETKAVFKPDARGSLATVHDKGGKNLLGGDGKTNVSAGKKSK